MKVLYFARYKQIIGRAEDEITLPDNARTVGDLLENLIASDPACAAAFANRSLIRAALDKSHVQLDHPLSGATEVAFFPPVTGG